MSKAITEAMIRDAFNQHKNTSLKALASYYDFSAGYDAALSAGQAQPVAYQYRWKLDGEWTNWRVSDASQKSPNLKDLEERPLYALTVAESIAEAARIGDAVLSWMVKYDLLDAGNEYRAEDVVASLNDFALSTPPAAAEAYRKALERIIDLDHHNMGPESMATKIARAALNSDGAQG